jgi:hypothetical protein
MDNPNLDPADQGVVPAAAFVGGPIVSGARGARLIRVSAAG